MNCLLYTLPKVLNFKLLWNHQVFLLSDLTKFNNLRTNIYIINKSELYVLEINDQLTCDNYKQKNNQLYTALAVKQPVI